ncbi:MAG: sigma-54-dependent transcriptional regulator [Thermoanaerobaculaceae bacterium]
MLVEDEPAAVRVTSLALRRAGFEVTAFGDAAAALRDVENLDPDVVLADHLLPGLSGLELVRYLNRRAPDLPVVLITAHGSEKLAVEALKLGAYFYLAKPLDFEELVLVLRRAVEVRRLRRESRRLQLESLSQELVGNSGALAAVRQLIAEVAPTEVTVLILGETGTGKELVARAIHRASRRAQRRFVAVNCAAIPETLLEAELFGYVKGAFTGAEGRREGKIVSASGGTLFLDEIGELPLSLQPKLLRALEEKEVTPLGSDRPVAVDVRLLAATNRDLKDLVQQGKFRSDLYFRLNVVPIAIPPLRARREDIAPLVQHLLPRIAARHGKVIRELDPQLLPWLTSQDWPGNVRELENALERLVVLSPDGILRVPKEGEKLILPFYLEKERVVSMFEKQYLEDALRAVQGNFSELSRRSGISPRHLYNLLRKHGLHGKDKGDSRG